MGTHTGLSKNIKVLCRKSAILVARLMNNPLYGQLDAGEIWNRTFNEFVTRQGPPASTGTSASHAAEIEVAQA